MKEPYERLVVTAMLLWDKHHDDYQNLRTGYEDLLMQRISLGIRPLHKIKKSALAEWIEIPFLEERTEKEAEEFLLDLTTSQIQCVIADITVLKSSYIWFTLKERIVDYAYEIYRFSHPKVALAVNPDGISSRYYGPSHYSGTDE